ncbi:SpoIIIAH-like family protein [Paenibacillus caui]|uniref:SpoIIIAH-like family protein n=1 Tax=Paenibacillus caui TaxID=2873927 RepID=UPI001CA87742|nr:SpoIIIAH-like family protein [Paenibacillus caui]
MKTKRQTIWLVSMLSLMVILSAYYLFTEDSGSSNPKAAEGQQVTVNDGKGTDDATAADDPAGEDGAVATEITGDEAQDGTASSTSASDDQSAAAGDGSQTQADNAAAGNQTADGGTSKDQAAGKDGSNASAAETDGKSAAAEQSETSKSDEEVLQTVEAQGTAGSDIITNYQYERQAANAKKEDELLQAMSDLSKSPEENAKAGNELNALQDKESKITSIEEQISQKFGDTVVTEGDSGYKVIVKNDKLQAKEAASIIDLVISELGVSQEKVKVEYISTK